MTKTNWGYNVGYMLRKQVVRQQHAYCKFDFNADPQDRRRGCRLLRRIKPNRSKFNFKNND